MKKSKESDVVSKKYCGDKSKGDKTVTDSIIIERIVSNSLASNAKVIGVNQSMLLCLSSENRCGEHTVQKKAESLLTTTFLSVRWKCFE